MTDAQATYNGHESASRLRRMYVVAICGWDAPERAPMDVAELADRLTYWSGSARGAAILRTR